MNNTSQTTKIRRDLKRYGSLRVTISSLTCGARHFANVKNKFDDNSFFLMSQSTKREQECGKLYTMYADMVTRVFNNAQLTHESIVKSLKDI